MRRAVVRCAILTWPLSPLQDTLRECHRDDKHCLTYLPLISPVYFVTFVLIAQFVLVNVVVAVLMKHLEESNKEAKEDAEMDAEIELEMSRGVSTPVRTPDGGGPLGSHNASKPGSPFLVKHQGLVKRTKQTLPDKLSSSIGCGGREVGVGV